MQVLVKLEDKSSIIIDYANKSLLMSNGDVLHYNVIGNIDIGKELLVGFQMPSLGFSVLPKIVAVEK